jgi:hypothetical protein
VQGGWAGRRKRCTVINGCARRGAILNGEMNAASGTQTCLTPLSANAHPQIPPLSSLYIAASPRPAPALTLFLSLQIISSHYCHLWVWVISLQSVALLTCMLLSQESVQFISRAASVPRPSDSHLLLVLLLLLLVLLLLFLLVLNKITITSLAPRTASSARNSEALLQARRVEHHRALHATATSHTHP